MLLNYGKYNFLRMKKILLLVLSVLIISCVNKPEYNGFKRLKNGTYYKLNKIGEEDIKVQPGDYLTTDIQYLKLNDSVFFKGRRKLQVSEPAYKGSIDECFMMLSEKENATFILSASDFFKKSLESELPSFLMAGDKIKINIEIIDIQTKEQYLREKEAFLKWIEDFGDYEKVILKQFISQKQINVKPTRNGLYQLVLTKGNGKKIKPGDTITVNYEGKFLDGKFFDSTKKRNSPFQFVYGSEMQVIDGVEKALAYMEEGEKSLFILPSETAFGPEGSSTGIIPPYTSLIYEIEVLEVKKGN